MENKLGFYVELQLTAAFFFFNDFLCIKFYINFKLPTSQFKSRSALPDYDIENECVPTGKKIRREYNLKYSYYKSICILQKYSHIKPNFCKC